MAVKYSYAFTEKAENDLNEILQYIAEDLRNPTAASNFVKDIFDSIDTVTAYPQTGLPVENEYITDKTVRRVLINNYSLYYKVDNDTKIVYILRIVYSKRDFNEIAKTI